MQNLIIEVTCRLLAKPVVANPRLLFPENSGMESSRGGTMNRWAKCGLQ
jgi:hypothetical protein